MKLTVTTHKVSGYRQTQRTAQYLADQAGRLVARSVSGRMPDVQIVLTTARGLAELATAAEAELAGGVDKRALSREMRHAVREARDVAGRAVPLVDGSVLVLVNVDQHRTPDDFAVTLVHELVHAMQFSRKGVSGRIIRDRRHCFGVERQTRRQAREHERLMREEENEAYGREFLARQLIAAAA
ncbi:hypothetical protein DWB77_03621 [Streptomyces hundungensis]|uniref:Uncharacterized protein n=1 Tax=Streptomyces hundungensis TaxID=1077946 RepID=A0A387HGT4_9ACTN|nr:hypothetical protein [Streptomyces hundungensis]AYG81473.1 hypothetical protein DWB77_03621 [Streptomyces hundungensis]